MPTLHNPTIYENSTFGGLGYNPGKVADLRENNLFYVGRNLWLTNHNRDIGAESDRIQLDPELKPYIEAIQNHMGELGVSHVIDADENFIWNTRREEVHSFPADEWGWAVYLFDDQAHALRPDRRRLNAVKTYVDKNNWTRRAREKGFSIPETVIIETDEEWVAAMNDEELEYKLASGLYVKGSLSMSGSDVKHVRTKDEMLVASADVGDRLQLQESVRNIRYSTSGQYYAVNGELTPIAVFETYENHNTHSGHSYPSRHDPSEVLDPIARDLARMGMVGFFGIDAKTDNRGRTYALDANPRITGTLAPHFVAQILDIESYTAAAMPTTIEDPGDVDLGDTIFDKADRAGAVIVSYSQMGIEARPKVELIAAGNRKQQKQILAEMMARLNPSQAAVKFEPLRLAA